MPTLARPPAKVGRVVPNAPRNRFGGPPALAGLGELTAPIIGCLCGKNPQPSTKPPPVGDTGLVRHSPKGRRRKPFGRCASATAAVPFSAFILHPSTFQPNLNQLFPNQLRST